jgi:hypothetical protein
MGADGMVKWIITVGLLAVLFVLPGCGESKKVAPTTIVSGTVNMDGKPLDEKDGAEITFSAGGGEAPSVLPIKAGKFEGKAGVGENRVEIRAYKTAAPIMMDGKPFGEARKENFVPDKYNIKSEMKTTVTAAGAKDLKFDVESK